MMREKIATILITLVLLITGLATLLPGEHEALEIEKVLDPVSGSDIIENLGQLEDKGIKFYTMGRFRAALGEDGIRYSLERKMEDGSMRTDCWDVEFTGALSTTAEASDPTSTTYNFFYGSDLEKWVTDVHGYSSVIYENIYPGIDLLFHTDTGDMKYDLILHPGSDPANIMLTVRGHDSLRVIDNELLIELSDGTMIREKGLRVHYLESGVPIGSSFRLVDDDTFTFDLEDYDRTMTIVIDPVVYSTYAGGLGSDQAYGMYVDGDGNSYVTGQTTARSFPVTPGAYSTQWQGSQDAYLFRMNDDGTDIDFCTLIGGSNDESGFVVTLDGSDNIYLAGRVASSDFPTTNGAYSSTYSGSYDLFVCKFDPTASNLLFSTYVGGESSEYPQNIALDGSNNIFVGGIVNGQGFPTTSNVMGSDYGGGDIDGFIFKMNSQGSRLTYSTYIGGDHDDRVTGLVLDDQGYAYISGYTRSTDFQLTAGAYDTTLEGSSDGYVMKVPHDGSAPVFSTLFGGDAGDGIYDLAMTDDGDLMFTGLTYSTDLPTTPGVYSTSLHGDADVFLTKMDIGCTVVKACTYLGGSGYERPTYLRIGPFGRAAILGDTSSTTYPVTNDAMISTLGDFSDNFLMVVSSDWSSIQYSTYLGGGMFDTLGGGGFDDKGAIYCSGSTDNTNFPTTQGSFDPVNNGFEDVYVFSISMDIPPSPPRNPQARSGDGFVNLTWDTPETPGSLDLLGFDIYRGESSLDETKHAMVGNVLHFNDTDVENGRTYFYYVRAKNPALDSVPSLEVQATPLGTPSTPENLQCSEGLMKVDISWMLPVKDGGSQILGYRLFRSDGDNEDTTSLPPDVLTYTDDDVVAGTEYGYSIAAYNSVGSSPLSAVITATPFSIPTPPRNVTARSGDGFVELSWKAPESDGGMMLREYNVYRTVNGGESILLKNLHFSILKFNDTTVHNGVNYAYSVTAVNTVGESAPAEPTPARPMTIPSVPLNFKALGGDGEVFLEWEEPLTDGGSDITTYSIRRTLDDGEGEIIFTVEAPEESYRDEDVENGVAYHYSISASNRIGRSLWTQELSTTPASVPASPDLHVISYGPDFILLEWTTPSNDGGAGIISYELFKRDNSSDLVLIRTFNIETLRYNDTDVEAGAYYEYVIRAVNRVGPSYVHQRTQARPVGRPGMLFDVSIRMLDRSLELSWSIPASNGGSEIIGYTMERTEAVSGSIDTIDIPVGGLSYTDEDVELGYRYQYRLAAMNEMGVGPWSPTVESFAYRTPSPVQGLIAEKVSGGIDITWEPIDTGETGDVTIEVRRAIDSGDPLTMVSLDGTITKYRDMNIRSGAVYSYSIVVKNGIGSSDSSDIVEVDTSIESSGGVSAAGLAILMIGTLIPLILAVVFIIIAMKRKKDKEKETPPPAVQEQIPGAVVGAPMEQSFSAPPRPPMIPDQEAPYEELSQPPAQDMFDAVMPAGLPEGDFFENGFQPEESPFMGIEDLLDEVPTEEDDPDQEVIP